jgi:hypothetical protein
MIGRAFEWFRIVTVTPTSEMIDKRIEAAQSLIAEIDAAGDWTILIDATAGVVAGFENFKQDDEVVSSVVSAIKRHDSAFPTDLTENALELRACAALAIGEIVSRSASDQPSDAVLAASLLRSGLFSRPMPAGVFLKQMLDELTAAAQKTLTTRAAARRRVAASKRKQPDPPITPVDLSGALTAISTLKATIDELATQATRDREELDILWWMFAGNSTAMKTALIDMNPSSAAVCAAFELGQLCLSPPGQSLEALVRRACESGRKEKAPTERTLEKFVTESTDALRATLGTAVDAREFAREHPQLLPITWLADRVFSSQSIIDWGREFAHMTGLSGQQAARPARWALQMFLELQSYRAYEASLGS